jgi:hypothetical protein
VSDAQKHTKSVTKVVESSFPFFGNQMRNYKKQNENRTKTKRKGGREAEGDIRRHTHCMLKQQKSKRKR